MFEDQLSKKGLVHKTAEVAKITGKRGDLVFGQPFARGFSLVELLVVMAIISILTGFLLPALGKARQQARRIAGANNQKQTATAVNFFACDHNDMYPDSVATVGVSGIWNWSDPRKLIGKYKRTPVIHRAISEYLGSYIEDADILFCPNSPQKYKWLHESWQAGDDWDNPDTAIPQDPVGGTYCFWWGYIGYLGPGERFVGPKSVAGGLRESTLLISDFFGHGQSQSRTSFGSCDRFKGADITEETWLMSAYWSCPGDMNSQKPDVSLNAAYTDGHVERFTGQDTVPMCVSRTADGSTPYPPPPLGVGIFYLPRGAL